MSNPQEKGRGPSSWSGHHLRLAPSSDVPSSYESQPSRVQNDKQVANNSRVSRSQPPAIASRSPARPTIPTRASTIDTLQSGHSPSTYEPIPQARSEDLNHSSYDSSTFVGSSRSSPKLSPSMASSNRPSTPTGSKQHHQPNQRAVERTRRRLSDTSNSSANSGTSGYSPGSPPSLASTSLTSA
jgi:hypothetical protein